MSSIPTSAPSLLDRPGYGSEPPIASTTRPRATRPAAPDCLDSSLLNRLSVSMHDNHPLQARQALTLSSLRQED
jgi:hypothetical protein